MFTFGTFLLILVINLGFLLPETRKILCKNGEFQDFYTLAILILSFCPGFNIALCLGMFIYLAYKKLFH